MTKSLRSAKHSRKSVCVPNLAIGNVAVTQHGQGMAQCEEQRVWVECGVQRGAIETLQENNMKTNALGEGRPTP